MTKPANKPPDPPAKKVSQKQTSPEDTADAAFSKGLQALLQEGDVGIIFEVNILGKKDVLFHLRGAHTLPGALRPLRAPTTREQFESIITNGLLEPLLERFNELIGEGIHNMNPLPEALQLPVPAYHDNQAPDEPVKTDGPQGNPPADPGVVPG